MNLLRLTAAAALFILAAGCATGEIETDASVEWPDAFPPDAIVDGFEIIDMIPDGETAAAAGLGHAPYPASGGGVVRFESYRMEIFVAPAVPVGKATTAGHAMKLGPCGPRGAP
ncbi:MAG: hypothetical protein ABIJ56_20275 [Pseudomonadota bacterium]